MGVRGRVQRGRKRVFFSFFKKKQWLFSVGECIAHKGEHMPKIEEEKKEEEGFFLQKKLELGRVQRKRFFVGRRGGGGVKGLRRGGGGSRGCLFSSALVPCCVGWTC